MEEQKRQVETSIVSASQASIGFERASAVVALANAASKEAWQRGCQAP